DLRIDYEARTMAARAALVKAGDIITIDGSTGEVIVGEVPTIQPELSGDFATLMGWADAIRRLKVRANAETATYTRTARRFGAEGIGLSRTEHMFFEADRIGAMRRVIMAEDEAGRRAGLAELLPIQRGDFAEIILPLIATKKEFDILKTMIDRVGKEVMEREDTIVPYLVGTMIELPRAALLAGEIAETAEFFSFGTNDLTQTVFGLSRDDAAS